MILEFPSVKKNVACTSNYYSEKERKHVGDFLDRDIFWFFGNYREGPQYLVSSVRKSFVAAQIQPDAAEKADRIGDPIATALEHFDLVVQSFDPAAV